MKIAKPLFITLLLAATLPHLTASSTLLPTNWQVFGPIPKSATILKNKDLAKFTTVPSTLAIDSRNYSPKTVKASNGKLNFATIFYNETTQKYDKNRVRNCTYLFTTITSDKPSTLWLGAGADWWMRWYVNGKLVCDTFKHGNGSGEYDWKNHPFQIKLQKGQNLISVIVLSGSNGWSLVYGGGNQYGQELKQLIKARSAAAKRNQRILKDRHKNARANSRMKLAIFGSSVARGAGAKNSFGWAAHLKQVLEKQNWQVVNKSIGGDTTTKLMARFKRDLLAEKPDAVIIGLSLANEGVRYGAEFTYRQYCRNMKKLIQMCHKYGITPMVSNCYPHNQYTSHHYEIIKRFNLELNTWPVASFNFLGTVDDGNGRWQKGHWNDGGHPNSIGHEQMFYAIPPSLFDNLLDPYCPAVSPSRTWLQHKDKRKLSFSPSYKILPFCYSFRVKFDATPQAGTVIALVGNNKILINKQGGITYRNKTGKTIDSSYKVQPGQPLFVALSSSYSRGHTDLYVNDTHVGSLNEKIQPKTFLLAGDSNTFTSACAFKDMCVYRSFLNNREIINLFNGNYLRSSLELFAPLSDINPPATLPLANLAPTDAAVYYRK